MVSGLGFSKGSGTMWLSIVLLTFLSVVRYRAARAPLEATVTWAVEDVIELQPPVVLCADTSNNARPTTLMRGARTRAIPTSRI